MKAAKIFLGISAIFLAMLVGGATFNGSGSLPVPVGYCYSSSIGSATPLSSFTNGPGSTACNGVSAQTLSTYNYIILCAYGANVNWLDIGTPTATIGSGGQQLPLNTCQAYTSSNPSGLQFIQQSSGATVGAMIYRIP